MFPSELWSSFIQFFINLLTNYKAMLVTDIWLFLCLSKISWKYVGI